MCVRQSKQNVLISGFGVCERGIKADVKVFLFFHKFIYLFFWLHWVFVAAHGLSLVAASRSYSSLRCVGFSLRSMGSRRVGFSSCRTWVQ